MALATLDRATVFQRAITLLSYATGAEYDDRAEIGSLPNRRTSYFVLGVGKSRHGTGREGTRQQAGESVIHIDEYEVEYADRGKPKDRDTRRMRVMSVMDSIERAAMGQTNAHTAGLEVTWRGETISKNASGEWWFARGKLALKYQFALVTP